MLIPYIHAPSIMPLLSLSLRTPQVLIPGPQISPYLLPSFFSLQDKLDPRLAHRGQMPMMSRRIGIAVSSRC
jgi:hypothetical protein